MRKTFDPLYLKRVAQLISGAIKEKQTAAKALCHKMWACGGAEGENVG